MKDYKKILEGVVNIINTTEKNDIGFANICAYIGDNCPELKESEDERMIKFIKNQLFNIKKTITDNYKLDTELTKAIDWLEKQGEKPQRIVSAEAKEAMYDKPAPVRTGAIGFDGEPMESKPCEQKPADKVEPKFKVKYAGCEYNVLEVKDIAGVTYYGIEDEPNHIDYVFPDNCEIVSEQKSAWSEEDENMWSQVINEIEAIKSNSSTVFEKNIAQDKIDWLKSLKDRVVPQQQEWSEEDEHILKEIISFIPYHLTAESYTLFINWLKSLRPQSQWKPSEEQIEALYTYIYNPQYFNSPDPRMELVESVYKDLKKLKDE